jgi:rhodanese-related sulfurtransferase
VARVLIDEIDITAFADHVANGARVIDVREPHEFAAGHVPGAELIPLATVAEHLDRFLDDGPTYVICRTGARSMQACEIAADHGHAAVNVTGGTMAWALVGHPLSFES